MNRNIEDKDIENLFENQTKEKTSTNQEQIDSLRNARLNYFTNSIQNDTQMISKNDNSPFHFEMTFSSERSEASSSSENSPLSHRSGLHPITVKHKTSPESFKSKSSEDSSLSFRSKSSASSSSLILSDDSEDSSDDEDRDIVVTGKNPQTIYDVIKNRIESKFNFFDFINNKNENILFELTKLCLNDERHISSIMMLLSHVNINHVDKNGRTVLFFANNENLFNLFISAGVDLNISDVCGRTFIYYFHSEELIATGCSLLGISPDQITFFGSGFVDPTFELIDKLVEMR